MHNLQQSSKRDADIESANGLTPYKNHISHIPKRVFLYWHCKSTFSDTQPCAALCIARLEAYNTQNIMHVPFSHNFRYIVQRLQHRRWSSAVGHIPHTHISEGQSSQTHIDKEKMLCISSVCARRFHWIGCNECASVAWHIGILYIS